MTSLVAVRGLTKTFTLHIQGGVQLPVLRGVELSVDAGECIVLGDPSGAGKSTLLRTRSSRRACTETSRPPVGSSMKTRRGSVTRLRAICRRWRMPPE